MNNKFDNLLKTDEEGSQNLTSSDVLIHSKRKIKSICKALCKETKNYKPAKTIETIRNYVNSKTANERILYSELSSFIYELDDSSQGILITNLENLLIYSLDEQNSVEDTCSKIVIKIYDHIHLAISQKNMTAHSQLVMQKILTLSLDNVKSEVKKELTDDSKKIEKEYISILGIFASVVLAFVGGITFSSSVLQNIDSISIYRLLIVIDLLAIVLVNTIYILIKFICQINDKGFKLFKIKILNITFGIIAILIVIAWFVDIYSLTNYINDFFPWIT